jgi:hypothetical protein
MRSLTSKRTVRGAALVLTGIGVAVLVTLGARPRTSAADDSRQIAVREGVDDMEKIQGVWERQIRPEEKLPYKRCVKQIAGNREVVTYYGDDGKVQREHIVEFRLEKHGPVKLFTFWNTEITEGPEKGKKVEGKRSYIYRLVGDELSEVWGFLPDQEKRPISYHVHQRTKSAASPAAPAEGK